MTDLRRMGAALLSAALIAVPAAANAAPLDDLPFASAISRATHNSYSGNIAGTRGSITHQLDSGVRFLEFDIWSGDYASAGDYRIGHSSAGDQVDHTGGNPAGDHLRDWLTLVNTWSAAHPTASPITVLLDLKDDLTTRTTAATGNLGALNQQLADVFGTRLIRSLDTPGALPAIGSLRGRVLTVLSGSAAARTGYKRDTGSNPAIAINAAGRVVEVHDNGSGVLWYWTGTYGTDGKLTWQRHGRYDTGKNPAVALNNDGTLVEVHQAPSGTNLWSRIGHLDAAGEITWSASAKYDTGVLPTVAFTDPAGTAFREIHQSQSNSQNWDWKATAGAATITWGAHATTTDARFPTTTAGTAGRTVTVSPGTLTATTDRAPAAARIRYAQLAFVEYQSGDTTELKDGALFWAATASNKAFIISARQSGATARAWDFDSASLATDPLANFPATNSPDADWYKTLLTRPDTVS
ncbi:hypothetical protein GCM10010435_58520 [Winogradskya consettensis]|uniref:Uncharacterized protein n=1 Tax=Winogradskya consettensis TaxID=113560 RepID=A0A919VKW8_9ACTN|nr:hypothetical protein [Actinoplanes consettensis]GIM66876.1 hypothetical protein Aco04nite_03800 [Actinoplanes consettensis]